MVHNNYHFSRRKQYWPRFHTFHNWLLPSLSPTQVGLTSAIPTFTFVKLILLTTTITAPIDYVRTTAFSHPAVFARPPIKIRRINTRAGSLCVDAWKDIDVRFSTNIDCTPKILGRLVRVRWRVEGVSGNDNSIGGVRGNLRMVRRIYTM